MLVVVYVWKTNLASSSVPLSLLCSQVIQKLPYGQSADMWAVGTVLYRCISGTHPFIPNESCVHKELNFKGGLACQHTYLSVYTLVKCIDSLTHSLTHSLTVSVCLCIDSSCAGFTWKKASPACIDFIKALLARDEALRPSARTLLSHPWFAEYTLISDAMLPE